MNGGYDEGYTNCPCLWGREPGSLVREHLARRPNLVGLRALDLGCGEGKNAHALFAAGAAVVASDVSEAALRNARAAWPDDHIEWLHEDAATTLSRDADYDLVVMYGLLHCLADEQAIYETVKAAQEKTRDGGRHILVAFNNGPHDLSAHPGFRPTMLPHEAYGELYRGWELENISDAVLHETHPHNGIPHFHSLTRLVARR